MQHSSYSAEALRKKLKRIHGKSYKAYRDIKGRYRFENFVISIIHPQGDPFAPPTVMEVFIQHKDAQFPTTFYASESRILGMEDFLLRELKKRIRYYGGGIRGTGNSGLITACTPGQEVLRRDAVQVSQVGIRVILQVGLPGRGRTVDGLTAVKMIFHELKSIIQTALFASSVNLHEMEKHIRVVEDQEHIRKVLPERGLVAFVADGSVLPRRSGIDERPPIELPEVPLVEPLETGSGRIIPFKSPETLRVEIVAPNAGRLTGMGIPEGVTVITGGGFHGKSTLLNALIRCVYPHVPGDGREYVVTREDGVLIRAEDGRSIERVDISNFINNLPFGISTSEFSTRSASGSTSQAANIMEYIEAGSRLFFIDEDTSATNFMVRDAIMQEVVKRDFEPITPFVERVREMYEFHRISCVLVTGGIGDFIGCADTVILMKEYVPFDVTGEAKEIYRRHRRRRKSETPSIPFRLPDERVIDPHTFSFLEKGGRLKIKPTSLRECIINGEKLNLDAVGGVVEVNQLNALGRMLGRVAAVAAEGNRTLRHAVAEVFREIEKEGFDILDSRPMGHLALTRPYELFAAISRLRTLKVKRRIKSK